MQSLRKVTAPERLSRRPCFQDMYYTSSLKIARSPRTWRINLQYTVLNYTSSPDHQFTKRASSTGRPIYEIDVCSRIIITTSNNDVSIRIQRHSSQDIFRCNMTTLLSIGQWRNSKTSEPRSLWLSSWSIRNIPQYVLQPNSNQSLPFPSRSNSNHQTREKARTRHIPVLMFATLPFLYSSPPISLNKLHSPVLQGFLASRSK